MGRSCSHNLPIQTHSINKFYVNNNHHVVTFSLLSLYTYSLDNKNTIGRFCDFSLGTGIVIFIKTDFMMTNVDSSPFYHDAKPYIKLQRFLLFHVVT